jgi:putative membrane protein
LRIITYLLLFIIILLGVSFAVLNPDPVTINYYIGHRLLPLSLLLVYVFAVGGLLGLLLGLWLLLTVKIKNYRLRHQLELAEKEIGHLRVSSIQNQSRR